MAKAKVVIIDLRNNPGGLMKYAIGMNNLLRKDKTGLITNPPIVYIKERQGVSKYKGNLFRAGKFREFKLIVLVNEGSASSSEIVTAYLKNDCDAKVVGKNTFGKGVGQSIITLSNGATLRVTSFEYLVGHNKVAVNGVGVAPDYDVDNPESVKGEKDDKQLQKAISLAEEMLIK